MAEPMIYVSSEDLARRLHDCFSKVWPVCHVASTPSDAISILSVNRSKSMVAVLDTGLPWRSSFSVLNQIQQSRVPTLYLANHHVSMSHMKAMCDVPCAALESPATGDEIVAAVDRLDHSLSDVVAVGDVELDRYHGVAKRAGEELQLTRQEFALLQVFMENPGVLLSREELLYLAWGFTIPGETRTVDVHVQRLRAKISYAFIQTIRSKGYMVTGE